MQAYRCCARIARQSAGNFYWTFLTLPKFKRRAITALYAFCRAGDDAVDDESADKAGRLEQMRRRLDLVFAESYCDLLTLALAEAARSFRFERQPFDDLIMGMATDLQPVRIQTESELDLYCYRVASTVGLICLRIFDADSEPARRYAVELGKAMQMTNILRDLREDYARGRVYLPEEHLQRFGMSGDRLFAESNAARLCELVRWEAHKAQDKFELAGQILPENLKGKLIAARAMSAIYRAILERIARADHFNRRIEITFIHKAFLIYREFLDL